MFFLFNSICIMLVLGAMIKHFWQQIYKKRSNFVIVNLQVLNFALGLFIHVITALSTPADMQSCLNSESKTLDLMEAKKEKLFCCIPVIFISPVFRPLPHT